MARLDMRQRQHGEEAEPARMIPCKLRRVIVGLARDAARCLACRPAYLRHVARQDRGGHTPPCPYLRATSAPTNSRSSGLQRQSSSWLAANRATPNGDVHRYDVVHAYMLSNGIGLRLLRMAAVVADERSASDALGEFGNAETPQELPLLEISE